MGMIFSGLGGMLVILFLTYLSEKKRNRITAAIELTAYIDAIYTPISEMFVQMDAFFIRSEVWLSKEEYNLIYRKLTALLSATHPEIIIKITYCSGDVLEVYTALIHRLRFIFDNINYVSGKLIRKERTNDTIKKWENYGNSLLASIDPLNKQIIESLIRNTKYPKIIRDLIYDIICKNK